MAKRYYTQEENNYIKEHWGTTSCKEVANTLDRKENSVRSRASKLGVTNPPYWSKNDIEKLKSIYVETELTNEELEKIFDRDMAYITHKANELGLYREIHKEWADEEHKKLYSEIPNTKEAIQYVKENYGKIPIEDIAKKLRRTKSTIYTIASRNDIRYPEQKSELELKFANFLDSLNVKYQEQYKIWKYKADFFLKDHNLIIETYGDYWHCNPEIFDKPINETQEIAIKRDPKRTAYIKSKGYNVLIIWENDFYNNFEKVSQEVKSRLE